MTDRALLSALNDLLESDGENIGLIEQFEAAMTDLGQAAPDDYAAQRKALVDFLEAASTLTQGIVGPRLRAPFLRLISALEDLDRQRLPPLLRPAARVAKEKDDEETRGRPPKPTMDVMAIATFVGFADAIAEDISNVKEAEKIVAELIGISFKSFREQRSHDENYQYEDNRSTYLANRLSAKLLLKEQATKRGKTCVEIAELLIPIFLSIGSLPGRRNKEKT